MRIVSVRTEPELQERAIGYFQQQWSTDDSALVYRDAITRASEAAGALPQWYLLMDEQRIAGCAGLIPNDFISRCELMPWLCALYIEEDYRCQGHAGRLIEHAALDARAAGFSHLHLCTDMDGFYERYGFRYNGPGYHPWGETSRVYSLAL